MEVNIYGIKHQKIDNTFFKNIITPNQTHGNNIIEIITGKEKLDNCDGVFSSRKNNFKLAIKTADCSAIVFYDDKRYGIVHAGWKGLVNGIIEKMMLKFYNPKIFVAPFLNKFEIQKDFCYEAIYNKFGDKFFEISKNKIIFNFKKALKQVLGEKAVFDSRNTLDDKNLYSYRRNKTKNRNYIILKNNYEKNNMGGFSIYGD